MLLRLHATFLVLALTTLGVRPAEAQNPQRPFRGLFGGAQSAGVRGQAIDLSMSAFVGWDQPQPQLTNPLESSSDDRTLVSGPYSGGSAQVSYNHPGQHVSYHASGSAFTGYFPDNAENPWYDSYSGAAGLSWSGDLSRRTRLNFTGSANASTDFHAGALLGTPGGNTGGSFETSLVHEPSMSSQTQVTLTHDFSQKSLGTLYYGFQFSHFFQSGEFPDTGMHSIGGRFTHHLTKTVGYHLGYAYDHAIEFGGDNQPLPGIHNIDSGIDYARALSLTRTTKLSFSAGTNIASSSQVKDGQTTFSSPHFFLVGDVILTQELGQSWNLSSFYNRSVTYDAGFTQPGLYDSAGVTVSGLISRHLDVSANALYQIGRIGLEEPNYRSWSAGAQIRSAITRNIAAYASYYYFLSDFGADVALPTGVPRYVDRNGARAGITAWLPLWQGRGAP